VDLQRVGNLLARDQKYRPTKVIGIDVDGTLLINGKINEQLVKWCRNKKDNGFSLILWSARGEKHAINIAKMAKIQDIFDHILSKPGYIVDDQGWQWTKYTRIIRSLENN